MLEPNFEKGFLIDGHLIGSVNRNPAQPKSLPLIAWLKSRLRGYICYVVDSESGETVHVSYHSSQKQGLKALKRVMNKSQFERISECGDGACAGCKNNGTAQCKGPTCAGASSEKKKLLKV